MYIWHRRPSSFLPSHSVVSVLLIRCEMGYHEYKGDFAKTFINFVSPANIIKWNCRQRSLLLASLRSSSLPRLVAGNVKYFCLLKINVDSPSDICFSRLLWTWPRNLMQELSILYLYNILYNIYQILNIVDISATRIKLTVAKIPSSSLYKSSMK